MRIRTLLLVPLVAACGASDAAEPVLIEGFRGRSAAVHCEPVPGLSARGASVADVAPAGDSAILVLYGQEREVALVGPELGVRRVVRFAEDGPAGVAGPVSATLAGDTVLYVADQYRQALKLLDLGGRDRGAVRLPFPPQRVHATAGGVYVTPFVVGRHPARLVYRVDGPELEPVDISTRHYGDPGINTLANMAGVAAYADGRVVVTHEFVVPFAYEFRRGSGAAVRTVPVPLPSEVGALLRRPPERPLLDATPAELPVAVLAAAPDAGTGDLLFLTRSGREAAAGYPEKAVVRLDRELGYRRSYLLDVNAIRMAYLPERRISVVVDEVDQWFACPTA